MKILDWYIIKKFLGTFFYSIALLIIIVIVFDISEKIDTFISHNAPLHAIIFDYYLNFIPYFINLFIYLFTFISVIFFTSRLAGNTEIISMLSSGISFRRLLRPYMISAGFLAILSFYMGNFLIPKTNHKLRIFMNTYVENLTRDTEKNIHVQLSPGTFAYVESYNVERNTGYRFSLEKYDGLKLIYKLNARKIVRDTSNQKWVIHNFYIRTIDSLGHQHLQRGYTKDTTLALKPTDLYKIKQHYEEMNFMELNRYIKKEKEKGSLAYKKYEIAKNKRIAGPVAIIILTLMGVALTSRKTRGGIGMHLGLGIGLAFSYIFLMQISTVFSTTGNLSPALGAWIPNIIYLLITLYLLEKAPK